METRASNKKREFKFSLKFNSETPKIKLIRNSLDKLWATKISYLPAGTIGYLFKQEVKLYELNFSLNDVTRAQQISDMLGINFNKDRMTYLYVCK